MEQRKEPRLKSNRRATLTVLGLSGGVAMEACELDVSGSGVRLRVPFPIPCGSPVKVDTGEVLMLGDVCRCMPEQGTYIVGVRLSHTLGALDELEKLNRALLGEEFS